MEDNELSIKPRKVHIVFSLYLSYIVQRHFMLPTVSVVMAWPHYHILNA